MSQLPFFKRQHDRFDKTLTHPVSHSSMNAYRPPVNDDMLNLHFSNLNYANTAGFTTAGFGKTTRQRQEQGRQQDGYRAAFYQQLPDDKTNSQKLDSHSLQDDPLAADLDKRLKTNRQWLSFVFATWFIIALFFLVNSLNA